MIIESFEPGDTYALGKKLGEQAKPGDVFCLNGDLGVEEMEEVGYEDCFYGDGVTLIEWAGLISEILPETAVSVTIEKELEKGFDYRKITVEGR